MEKRTDRLTYKSPHGGYGYSHDLDMYDPEIKDYIGRLEDEKDKVQDALSLRMMSQCLTQEYCEGWNDCIRALKGLIE